MAFFLYQTTILANVEAEKTCKNIHAILQDKSNLSNQFSFFKTIVKGFFTKHKSEVYQQNVIITNDNMVEQEEEAQNNYIFLLKPRVSKPEYKRIRIDYQDQREELSILEENIGELAQTDSVNECVKEFHKYPVSEDEYNKLAASIKGNKIVNDMIAYEQALDQIEKVATRVGLQQRWIKVNIMMGQIHCPMIPYKKIRIKNKISTIYIHKTRILKTKIELKH